MGTIIRRILLVSLLLIPSLSVAETAWVIDQVQVGLHQDDSLDSPILKLLPTGAELDILEKGEPLSQVRDEEGLTGWIKNTHLQTEKPTRRLFEEVSSRNQQLKNQISKLQAQLKQDNDDQQLKALQDENSRLQQEIKSARLKSGELQAELTKSRKAGAKTAGNHADQELYTRIAELEQDRIRLEEEIKRLMHPAAGENAESASLSSVSMYFKLHVKYILGAIIFGIILGLFVYDIIHRRRHSGFRV
ncbi:MAG: TIGR04211 family SH3 domain-containing protein [Thiotrichales bacterium]|nr:TIGR04211 family SH3 domain-containing protein [Thiotrichales bacterium]